MPLFPRTIVLAGSGGGMNSNPPSTTLILQPNPRVMAYTPTVSLIKLGHSPTYGTHVLPVHLLSFPVHPEERIEDLTTVRASAGGCAYSTYGLVLFMHRHTFKIFPCGAVQA